MKNNYCKVREKLSQDFDLILIQKFLYKNYAMPYLIKETFWKSNTFSFFKYL